MVRGKHVVLVVEDDHDMAYELGERLAALGYEHIHVETQEAALVELEKDRFCCVLLDLELKRARDSIKADISVGQGLLVQIRARYPARNAHGKHCVQILIVSGHKHTRYVTDAFKSDANDFIVKSARLSSLEEKLRSALLTSDRRDHAECAAITRAAQITRAATGPHITIIGREVGSQRQVQINDKIIGLSPELFLMLLRLVAARLVTKDGWVHAHDLGIDKPGSKQFSRLKERLEPVFGEDPFEKNNRGSRRIALHIEVPRFDTTHLEGTGEERIEREVKSIRAIEPSRR